jgi:putative proteasome-type protease
LLPLRSAVDVALLATTAAALAFTHLRLLRPREGYWRTHEERFAAPAVSKMGQFAFRERSTAPCLELRRVTYCLGMLFESGLVLMADTRTNAGVDNFSTFRKLHTLADGPERQIYAATAGSLSLSQSTISLLQEDQLALESGERSHSLSKAPTMFSVAQLVGEAVARVGSTIGSALAREHIDNSLELLVGGRVGDEPLKLYLVYTIGNFIECTSEVPFLQIGETKYGRPILDRALNYRMPLPEAVKIGFLSFDSTMESNLAVAHPIDVLVLPADRSRPAVKRRIEEGDDYFREITRAWGAMLSEGVAKLPQPPWLTSAEV